MKKIYSTIILLLVALSTSLAATAAEPATAPVRWRTIIKTTGTDTGTITFKALVAPGWHLYGLDLPKGGPKPTTFDFEGCKGIRVGRTPKPSREPLEVDDPMFGMKLRWWDANVEFTVPFVMTDPAIAQLVCKINYMACDGNNCLPPTTETISLPVKLKPANDNK